MGQVIQHRKKINRDNKGSALVTVIVAAVFLAAVVTILLFVTAKNYKARQSDYLSKQNFYEAEKTLDELKTVFIEDCSTACSEAYIETLNNYINLSPLERQELYYKEFIESAKEIWEERSNGALLDTVKSTLSTDLQKNVESVGEIEYNEEEGYYLLKDVVVSCTTIDGYYSRIKSGIKVTAPSIDWGNGTTNEEEREILVEEYVIYSDWQRD